MLISEENSLSDNSDSGFENPPKKIKLKHVKENNKSKKSFKQPTTEEINNLKETENLYNNNIFRLQIEEFIDKSKIKNKHKLVFENWLKKFKTLILQLPVHEAINLSNFATKTERRLSRDEKFTRTIAKHSRNAITCDQDIPIAFARPESLNTFGLYKIDALVGPNLNINVAITIPKQNFNAKDYLNNRYFVKKFYYLMYIAESLSNENICSKIQVKYYKDNILLPILEVQPKESEKVFINIFAIPEPYFKGTRFLPDVNNVRTDLFGGLEFPDDDVIKDYPTCFYNASMGFEVTLNENMAYVEQIISNLPNVQSGLKLLTTWLNKRKLNTGTGSFTNDILVYIVSYLIQKGLINQHMSSYQVIRKFWHFMDTTNLAENPLSLCETILPEIIEKFKKYFNIVILDKSGCFNIAAFLDINIYLKVKEMCHLAIKLLDEDPTTAFANLFLVDYPFYVQYDIILSISPENSWDYLLKSVQDEYKVKYLSNKTLLITKCLSKFLRKSLRNRSTHVVPFVMNCNEWKFGTRFKLNEPIIYVGINLNSKCAFKTLDIGPALNDPKEAEFKEFWGPLAQYKRFEDGSACVTLSFEKKTAKEKRAIVKEILSFLMEKIHLNKYHIYYDEFEDVLLSKNMDIWYPVGTNEESCLKDVNISDELNKKLRDLKFSLPITGIRSISNVSCFTNIFPPISTTYRCGKTITSLKDNHIILNDKRLSVLPKYVEPIELVIELGRSSQWPDELNSLRHMKAYFYIEIQRLLQKNYDILSSVTLDYIEIFYKGLVFRFFVFVPQEMGLLKKQVLKNGLISYRDSEESMALENKCVLMPIITGALKGIHSQYPSYGVSTCLIKRWIRSMMIDEYLLPDVVIELVNAYQFIKFTQYMSTPNPQTAFFRFLQLILEYNWEIDPLILNFNNEIKDDSVKIIQTEMTKNRQAFPSMIILTPWDEKSVFTKQSPSKQVLLRVQYLAKCTLEYLTDNIFKDSPFDIMSLFIPSLDSYNVIIHLKPLLVPRRHQLLQENQNKLKFEKYSPEDSKYIPVTNFDPVQSYLKELREIFDDYCIFFYDPYGGLKIGVLLKPDVLKPKPPKVSYMLARKYRNDNLVLDIETITEDF